MAWKNSANRSAHACSPVTATAFRAGKPSSIPMHRSRRGAVRPAPLWSSDGAGAPPKAEPRAGFKLWLTARSPLWGRADIRCRDLTALEQDGGDLRQGVGARPEACLAAQVVHDRQGVARVLASEADGIDSPDPVDVDPAVLGSRLVAGTRPPYPPVLDRRHVLEVIHDLVAVA